MQPASIRGHVGLVGPAGRRGPLAAVLHELGWELTRTTGPTKADGVVRQHDRRPEHRSQSQNGSRCVSPTHLAQQSLARLCSQQAHLQCGDRGVLFSTGTGVGRRAGLSVASSVGGWPAGSARVPGPAPGRQRCSQTRPGPACRARPPQSGLRQRLSSPPAAPAGSAPSSRGQRAPGPRVPRPARPALVTSRGLGRPRRPRWHEHGAAVFLSPPPPGPQPVRSRGRNLVRSA